MNRNVPTIDQLLGVESLVCKDNQPKPPAPRRTTYDVEADSTAVHTGHMSQDLSNMDRWKRKLHARYDFTIPNTQP